MKIVEHCFAKNSSGTNDNGSNDGENDDSHDNDDHGIIITIFIILSLL